jgi:hypothetical protein
LPFLMRGRACRHFSANRAFSERYLSGRIAVVHLTWKHGQSNACDPTMTSGSNARRLEPARRPPLGYWALDLLPGKA